MTARDENASFRIFSTLNSRGVDLSEVDKLKADLLQVWIYVNKSAFRCKINSLHLGIGHKVRSVPCCLRTRMPLLPTLSQVLDPQQRIHYSSSWAEMENLLGRQQFHCVFGFMKVGGESHATGGSFELLFIYAPLIELPLWISLSTLPVSWSPT